MRIWFNFVPQEDGHESNVNFFRLISVSRVGLVCLDLERGTAKGKADQAGPGIGSLCEFLDLGSGRTANAALQYARRDELAFYRKEYPEKYEFGSPYAIEILYRFSQYFGWAQRNYRYGPYTNDPRVIELIRMIGETFENRSKYSGDASRFTLDERVSLGGAVVRRIGDVTALIPTFESITLFQFQEEMSDKSNKHTPLYQSRAVRSTLAAIDRADRPEALEGCERLAVLQNLLVDLLTYLEGVEGFRVSIGARKRARLRGSSAHALPAVETLATVLHQTRGRIRMGIPRLRWDEAYADRLQSLLETVDDIRSIRISAGTASVVINFSPEIPEIEFAGSWQKLSKRFFFGRVRFERILPGRVTL